MATGDLATTGGNPRETEVGSVFVSNYPPFSVWSEDAVDQVDRAFDETPAAETPLGIYLHIPFCRKRCKFCYFKVYTDKNASDIDRYIDAVTREIRDRVGRTGVAGRAPKFLYFGGGTPSYISTKHLRRLFDQLRDVFDWSAMEEVAFECEPGTLTESKLNTLRELGITRLSLGIENWDDRILEENGRAHVTKEIHRVIPWIRGLDFDQLNIDLIAGMVGETDATWKDSVQKTIDLAPESVTIYQMELPYNTIYSKSVLDGRPVGVADWATKRRWHNEAIDAMSAAGYEISSAYTMKRADRKNSFVYRDSVWQGCDLFSVGVSSFGHQSGVHYQNASQWKTYLDAIESGRTAVNRAYRLGDEEQLTREFILQLKLGTLPTEPLSRKFGVDVLERFAAPLARWADEGMLSVEGKTIQLSREGLLRVDSLLPAFYDPKYQNARYT